MTEKLDKFLRYLQHKGECIAYQEANPLVLDYDSCLAHIETIKEQIQIKTRELQQVMPKVPVMKTHRRPKITHKKDMTESSLFVKWKQLLKENDLPLDTKEVDLISGYEEPNPGSHQQVKDWLFSLGWEPCYYKDGQNGPVPQVRKEGELVPSVLKLIDKHPTVEVLEGYTVLVNRLSTFEAFRDTSFEVEDVHYIRATIGGLTNTLRFKHRKPLVNLPGVDKPWGKEIRGLLKAPEGYEVLGSDMVSLESTTKRHFIYPFDPKYAEEMAKPGFDEHMDLALRNGEITQEEYDKYKSYEKDKPDEYKRLYLIRKDYKPVNYSCVYGVGKKKLSRETSMSIKRASDLIEAYWERNWAVKECVKPLGIKYLGNTMWLLNPVSDFWYELRFEKDKFSTLNQGTGVFIFDSWLAFCKKRGYYGNAQFHDETLGINKIGERDKTKKLLKDSIEDLNKALKLNVDMGIDVQFGNTYAEVH